MTLATPHHADRLSAAVDYLRRTCRSLQTAPPRTAIVLGSGLGPIADQLDQAQAIPFATIPGFARSTAAGHRGQWVVGTLQDKPVVAMAGRLHRYEGWSNDEVIFPIEVMAALGVQRLVLSNAAGGLQAQWAVGDLMIVRDHINWMGGTYHWNKAGSAQCTSVAAVTGSEITASAVTHRGDFYDTAMADQVMQIAIRHGFTVHPGTYLATLGPTYETRSEYRMMRRLGADAVGMSTVPEALAAVHHGMRVLALSMISNVASPDLPVAADHQEVLQAGRAAAGKMEAIVRGLLCDE